MGERGQGDGEMGRWGDGEMGRWGDGESTCVRRNTTVEQSGEPVHAKRAAQGEMGNLIASKMHVLADTLR